MKKQKCNVCGKRFNIQREKVYLIQPTVGLASAFNGENVTWDAVDCPNCGCQCRLKERWMRAYELNKRGKKNDN